MCTNKNNCLYISALCTLTEECGKTDLEGKYGCVYGILQLQVLIVPREREQVNAKIINLHARLNQITIIKVRFDYWIARA